MLPDGTGAALEHQLAAAELRLSLFDEPQALLRDVRRLQKRLRRDGVTEFASRASLVHGRAALRAGAYAEAARALEQAVAADVTGDVLLRNDLARAYDYAGDPSRAVAFLRECLSEAERDQREEAYVRFAITLSAALTDIGDLQTAQHVLDDARPRTALSNYPMIRFRFHLADARLVDAAGMHLLALVLARRGIDTIAATDDTLWLGRAHLRAGEYAAAAGQSEAAGRHLERARELLGDDADVGDQVILFCELGRLAARAGHGGEAESWGRSALSRLGNDEPAERGRARWVIALGLVAQGRFDEACGAFELADQLLAPGMRYTVRLRRDWADALIRAGRHQEAASLLERVAAIERLRRLPEQGELLLREIEESQSVQRGLLDALEARVADAERALDAPSPSRRAHLRLAPPPPPDLIRDLAPRESRRR